ncbi:aBC-type sugar transport system periplasmic component [Ruminococcus sp. CAG:624]|nr:aBC-type sugar transport system periplasmic component [Ruminococcus sp. CAG:624]
MKKFKRYMASLTAFAAVFSLFSCQNNAKKSTVNKDLDPKIREELNDIVSNEELLTGELENKKIKWMATWDINPGPTGKNVPIELALFQERYGGEIEYYAVTWENRYDKLAAAIQSGEGIDFFSASDSDAFPKGAKGMFAPIDDYIDFDSPLWSDVKDVNDSIMWNGNHYVAVVFVTGDNCAVIYNRDTIEEAGLEDPAVLYEQRNWTWDTFEDMLIKFVDKDNKKFGIDGWWFEFGLMSTTGVPPVTIENQKLVNNLE